MTEDQSVLGWLRGQTALISGGSGFIGKAIIFKLLKCHVHKIIVLIRDKKGLTAEQRLDDVFNNRIYDSIREQDPLARQRLVAVNADVAVSGLALSEGDRKMIEAEVTAVYHIAASVKFDDPLKEAVATNLRSTMYMVELAKGIQKLQIFAYMSTAYSNCDNLYIEERVYKPKIDWKKLIKLTETTPDDVLNAMSPKLLGASPNTYVFTKHLAENVVADAAKDIPVVITRPPVVGPPQKEPIVGWSNSLSSPTAINAGIGTGILRILFSPGDCRKDYTPTDVVTDVTILAAWYTYLKRKSLEKNEAVTVYHMESKLFSPIDFERHSYENMYKGAYPYCLWWPFCLFIENRHYFLFLHIFLHVLPGALLDLVLRFVKTDFSLLRMYRKIYHALVCLFPLVSTEFGFELKNFYALDDAIPLNERGIFNTRLFRSDSEVTNYLLQSFVGLRLLLGAPAETQQKDFDLRSRARWIHYIFCITVSSLFLWYFPFDKVYAILTNILCLFIGL